SSRPPPRVPAVRPETGERYFPFRPRHRPCSAASQSAEAACGRVPLYPGLDVVSGPGIQEIHPGRPVPGVGGREGQRPRRLEAVRPGSILRHGGVDLVRPGEDAALEVLEPAEPLLAQELDRLLAAQAAL